MGTACPLQPAGLGSVCKSGLLALVSFPEQIPASGSFAGDPATYPGPEQGAPVTLTPVTHLGPNALIWNHTINLKSSHVLPLGLPPAPRAQPCGSGTTGEDGRTTHLDKRTPSHSPTSLPGRVSRPVKRAFRSSKL